MWLHVNRIDAANISSTVLRKFPHIWISTPLSTKYDCDWCNKNFIDNFYLLLNQYISNIYNVYNPGVNLSLAYQIMCDHMFSDPKSDHIFSYLCLHTWFIFCFFLYLVIVHLIRRRGGVGIYCKLTPDWTISTREKILFPSQYIMGIQNQSRNTTWISISKYHRVIRQQASLYLYSFISTESWVFITRFFPRP